MRIGHVQASRPSYYDRTAKTLGFRYTATAVAPHALTVRWAYTVPSGKSAYAQAVLAQIMRVTAGAPVGQFQSSVRTTANNAAVAILNRALDFTNTVNFVKEGTGQVVGFLQAGDLTEGVTQDLSTGGTVTYDNSAHIAEFDA